MRPHETLTQSQDGRLLPIRFACPDIARGCDFARALADLVHHQRGYVLHEGIRQAEQDAPKPMKDFAGFLRQDLDVVSAGLTSFTINVADQRSTERATRNPTSSTRKVG